MAKQATRRVAETSEGATHEERVAMTISSRRLARRCRERFAADKTLLPCPAQPTENATVKGTETAAEAQLEKVDATK